MTRQLKKGLVVVGAVAALGVPATGALAAPPPCEPGQTSQGCKTVGDPNKNNPKFVETQRGNVDARGTEDTCSGANPGHTEKVCP